ncbi:MAG: glycosyltransferase [Coriobacteriia bacterium]|nr:glycosyltransferase [Coriobacteriia bacterium]
MSGSAEHAVTVCHVTSVNIPTDGRILYHECRSLAKRWRTVLVCRDDGPARTLEGVEIVPTPRRGGRVRRWLEIRRVVALAAAQGADLYHFHNIELVPAMARFAERAGVPVIYDAHEHHPDAMVTKTYIPAPLRGLVAWMTDRIERRHVPRFDAVVVADEALERRYTELGARRVLCLHNFPPLDLFPPGVGMPSETPTLLYVGSISEVRGFSDMLETIRLVREEMSEARLVLVGSPTEEVAPRLAKLDPDVVTLVSSVPYGKIVSVMQGASIGLSLLHDIPKFQKNVPTKVFDYMASGIPYVSSDLIPVRELTGGTGGVLVAPGDVAAAARAALGLLRDRDAAAAAARDGRALVESKLNWGALESELFSLYEELLVGR